MTGLTVVMVPTTPWTLEGALKSPEDWAEYRLAVQELAVEAHEKYHEQRRAYVADPANGLIPWPKRRVKRKPEPGVIDLADEEVG